MTYFFTQMMHVSICNMKMWKNWKLELSYHMLVKSTPDLIPFIDKIDL